MASPQLENGYTRIANELYEALIKFNMPREVWKVVHTIIRKTYGYGKKEDSISLSQFCSLTGLQKRNVIRGIHKAISSNIVLRRENGYTWKYRLNKDFTTWIAFSVGTQGVSIGRIGVLRTENKGVSVGTHTKERKKLLQKKVPASREKMKTYNEESYEEPVIDSETGEIIQNVKVKGESQKLLKWAEERINKHFANPVKQFSCIKKMKSAGFSIDQIKQTWLETEQNDYWQEKGIDFGIILMQISKGKKAITVKKL